MRSGIKSFLACTALGLWLAACGSVTAIPTATPSATITFTPKPTATIAPTTTNTIHPTQTPVFPVPTMQEYSWETPTPITTPKDKSSDFHLTAMNETQFAHFIALLNEYSIKNYPAHGDWWTDSEFEESQQPVALAVQEYLYRYPNSRDAEQYRWQLAFIHALSGQRFQGANENSDSWLINSLQKELDVGNIRPENLDNFLERYWFDVVLLQPVKNLLGDGKIAWVYHIVPKYWQESDRAASSNPTNYWGGAGLIFIIREKQDGHFEIIPLQSAWNKNETSVNEIADHNQNGIPEIPIYVGAHSGTMCAGQLLLYEWKSDKFVELTQGKIRINDCGSDYSFSIDNKTPAIELDNMFVPKSIFAWDGEFYRFKDFLNATPLETWLAFGDYAGAKSEIDLLTKLLSGQDISEMGPGFPDYLRFRLGVVYALAAQRDDAIREFNRLVSTPADSKHDTFSKMAKRFLELYKDQKNIYRACTKTGWMYEKIRGPRNYPQEPEFFEKTLGIVFKDFRASIDVHPTCFESEAFGSLLKTIPATIINLPNELKKNGVSWLKAQSIDANLDGQMEWLIVIPSNDWYLVWQDGAAYQAKPIDLQWYFDENTDCASLSVSVEKWAALDNPIIVISTSNTQGILEIDKNFDTRWLVGSSLVQRVNINSTTINPIVQYRYLLPLSNKNNWKPFWEGYRWNPNTQSFDEDLLDYLLFVQKDPASVINILKDVLPLLPAWEKSPYTSKWALPRFYYLAGLAYELSGNEQQAVDLYWQLWRKFPESHYAHMVQLKLEPINP